MISAYNQRVLTIKGAFVFTASLIACLLLCLLPSVSSASSRASSFCDDNRPVKSFFSPIGGLPKGSGFRPSGVIGVGPSYLRIYPPKTALVASGDSLFEAHGAVVASGHERRPLNWWVTSRLERINRKGTSVDLVGWKQQHVASVRDFSQSQFGIRTSAPLGFYRLTVEIRSTSGVLERRIRQYYRAVKPSFNVRMTTSFSRLSPGDGGYLRLDNYGTVSVMYGLAYKIWNEAGQPVPVDRAFDAIGLIVEPGYAGSCIGFSAPATLSPGNYRIGVEAIDRFSGKSRAVSSIVEVVAP